MRVFRHFILVLCLTAGMLALGSAQTPSASGKSADTVLGDARKALGGDKLAAVKNFVATGRTKQIRGNNLVPIEFEIACELPDKYFRKDEVPAQESDPSTSGFNGDGLIQVPVPSPGPGARAGGTLPEQLAQAAAARKTRVTTIKQDFARLTLGMFANSFSAYPMTFTYAGIAEAPQGKADAIDAKGDGPLTLRLFINTDTHLPLMVSWTQPPTQVIVTVPGQKAPATVPPGAVIVEGPPAPVADASKEARDKYSKDVADLKKETQAKPVEYRVYYADYRDVGGGVMWPFRLRRAIGADTTEETTFDGFKINGKIDAKKFEVVK